MLGGYREKTFSPEEMGKKWPVLFVCACTLSEEYKGNYMFPLLVEEGGKKPGPHVSQELLN